MSTGWSISIGYNSGNGDKDEMWNMLKLVAGFVASQSFLIMGEAKSAGAPEEFDGENLLDYCEVYSRDWMDGGPMRIIEEEHVLHVMASGGDPSRTMKEQAARAFCRLVILSMHKKQIEVNLVVA